MTESEMPSDRLDLSHENLPRPPGEKQLPPHVVCAGNFAGQANVPIGAGGGLRTLDQDSIMNYAGVPIELKFKVPNRLGGEAEYLLIDVTLTNGPDRLLSELCEKVPALRILNETRIGLTTVFGALMSGNGPAVAAALPNVLKTLTTTQSEKSK